jgi:hypothetical protein
VASACGRNCECVYRAAPTYGGGAADSFENHDGRLDDGSVHDASFLSTRAFQSVQSRVMPSVSMPTMRLHIVPVSVILILTRH